MNLSRDQQQRLSAGDYTPLSFPFNSDDTNHGLPIHGPCCTILKAEKGYRISDQFGNVTVVPPRVVHWIEVTDIRRHRKGHWQLRFQVADMREHPSFLAKGGGYTSTRFRAIDELEVVPVKDQVRMSKVAYDRDQTMRLERVAASRVEKMRFRRERQHAMRRLSSAG